MTDKPSNPVDEPTKPATLEEARELARLYPERYTLGVNNSLYDREAGHIVAKFPSAKYDITPANSAQLRQRGKDIATIAHLRGLSKAMNVELPADAELEEVVQGAGSAVEALTEYMARTFLGSKNLRGMAESFGRLVSPLTGEIEDRGPFVVVNNNSVSIGDPKQHDQLERVWRDVMHLKNLDIVEATATDVPAEGDET